MRYFLLLLIILPACTKHSEAPADDYVLIEFASKLEEEYQKLEPSQEQKKSE
jgi:hypothetical protein